MVRSSVSIDCCQVLSEVRDYLIQLSRPEAVEKTENSEVYGHVYAPVKKYDFES